MSSELAAIASRRMFDISPKRWHRGDQDGEADGSRRGDIQIKDGGAGGAGEGGVRPGDEVLRVGDGDEAETPPSTSSSLMPR